MNKISSNDSIANNTISTAPINTNNNRFKNAYAFSKKVVKYLPSTRNCLMLVSSTATTAINVPISYQRAISDTSKNNSCNADDALSASLLCGLNTMLPTFLCVVLYAMMDAHDQKDNNTSVITTTDNYNSNDYEDIEKSMMTDQLIEDKPLARTLLTKIKLKLIDIKNNLKNIDKSEAFIYLILMFVFMIVITLSEYFGLSDCGKSIVLANAIIAPLLAFVMFSLPVMAIKKMEGMSID
jgi:hypothetical protein